MNTLIQNVCVVALDEAGTVLPSACIAIEGNWIAAVGAVPRDFRADETIDGYNHVALPGFFNSHTHAAMTLMRGHAEDLDPQRNRRLQRSLPVHGPVAQGVEESGMKASLAWALFGAGGPEVGGGTLERTLEFAARWQGGAGGRIRTVLGPHSPYLCPEPFLREVAAAARERALSIHIHVADVPCLAAHAIHATPADIAILANRVQHLPTRAFCAPVRPPT